MDPGARIVTMDPSCGSVLESSSFQLLICPNRPSRGKGKFIFLSGILLLSDMLFHFLPSAPSRGINELRNLQYLPRGSEARETLVQDRTRAHADHVGQGLDRMTTAAVGILKAVHCGEE